MRHGADDATCHSIDDQFMLGNATLVAPVVEAAARSRAIYLPHGRWLDRHRRVHEGPTWLIEHPVALDELATFELLRTGGDPLNRIQAALL